MTVAIDYKGLHLYIEGTYYKGFSGDYETPPDTPEFEIEKVYFNDADVTDLFEIIDDFHTIEQLVIENI